MSTRLGNRSGFLGLGFNIAEISLYIYFALTFFEPYLNGTIGSVTKYYIIIVIIIQLLSNGNRITIHQYTLPFVFWLIYRFITLLWTNDYYMFNNHVYSQIGMIALLFVTASTSHSEKEVNNVVKVIWMSSSIISLLSLFFGRSYHNIVDARQVLVLFGQEVDPNNQAAFALVGISIALYFAVYVKKHIILSLLTLLINILSMFKTGSRGALLGMAALVLFVIVFFLFQNKSIGFRVKSIFIFVVISVLLFYFIRTFLPNVIIERLFDFSTYEGGSERTYIWENAFDLLMKDLNLIFGAGWGAYYGYNGFYRAIHNTFLSMLCDVGIIGVALFFIPIVNKTVYCIKNKEYLLVMLLLAGLCPSFFLDAINKRFFWNPIIILFMYIGIKKQNRSVEEVHIVV